MSAVRQGRARWAIFAVLVVLLGGLGKGVVRAQPATQTKQIAATPHYAITGVVIDSVHGDPVTHCHLTPSLYARGRYLDRQSPALTNGFDCDVHGHFSISLPSAGAWVLNASARGFVSQGFDEHQTFSSAIVLTAEAPTKDVEFRITPEASIVGRVLDEAGEPVRNAQVLLQNVPPASPGGPQPLGGTRSFGRTDDRGMYELTDLAPGSYRLSVHATPWYAANTQVNVGRSDPNTSSPDPSLDFAYPTTWFPGVSDPAQAEVIVLHAGDVHQSDFHLLPIPSIHMRILAPSAANNGPNGSRVPMFPLIQPISSGLGGQPFVQVTTRFDAQGQIDVGGLTPGTYQVRLNGPNQEGHSVVVEVNANSVRTLDFNSPSRDTARITLHFEGLPELESNSRPERNGGVQVTLIDRDTQHGTFFSNGGGNGINFGRGEAREPGADRVMEVPPGRYEVVLQGRPNIFLTGLTAKKAETAGRYVTVGSGESSLTVHVASGRASLSGIATLEGQPVEGAMVLLVPVTIEDPNSITVLQREQTNTDGSFDLINIIPGQYILVVIDHGWEINWGDPSTLRRYLMQGVPLELKSLAVVKQNVTAQVP